MAQDITDPVNYYLQIERTHQNDLAAIRHWSNLKIAFDETHIWVRDFDHVQMNAFEVKSIPYKNVYYSKNGKLFLLNSLLPDRNIPSLLWTPIERALPVELPSFNHNFFGIHEKIAINLVPSAKETDAFALVADISLLHQYISTAAAIRLKSLSWVKVGSSQALILGRPLLPVSGKVLWQMNNFLIPAGYAFELAILAEPLANLLNPERNCWIIWDTDNTYSLIRKKDFQPLSLSSFRITNQLSSF